MWDLIVSVPDHCLSFYFSYANVDKKSKGKLTRRHLLVRSDWKENSDK